MKKLKELFSAFVILERSLPSAVTALFVVSVVAMNLLANKSIDTHTTWLALDCGIIFSWVIFLLMDTVTKRFGPKAANLLAVAALAANLFIALMLFIASVIPGVWSESFEEGAEDVINRALDNTFKGTWFVLLGSSVAFIVSAFINNFLNWLIGAKLKKKTGFAVYAIRAYLSTVTAQFADNLIFALIVAKFFFGWSIPQCLTCAATGAVAELLFEVVLSPVGYRISERWERDNVGKEYLDYISEKAGENNTGKGTAK